MIVVQKGRFMDFTKRNDLPCLILLGYLLFGLTIYYFFYFTFMTPWVYASISMAAFWGVNWTAFRLYGGRWWNILILSLFNFSVCLLLIALIVFDIMLNKSFTIEFFQLLSVGSLKNLFVYHKLPAAAVFAVLLIFMILLPLTAWNTIPGYRFKPLWNGVVLLVAAVSCVFCLPFLTHRNLLESVFDRMVIVYAPDVMQKHGLTGIFENRDMIEAVPGCNLVHIILESAEKNFLDNREFPGLLPSLQKISGESILFTDIRMAPNAILTFGGIFASLTGINLTPLHMKNGFDLLAGKRLGTMPEILHKAGYKQYFLYGHNTSYDHFNAFFEREHYNVVMLNNVQSRQEHNLKYENALRDAVVFEKAWEQFRKLSENRQPFSLTVLTVDTHAPDGACDADKKFYKWNERETPHLLHAFYNMDTALGKLVRKIRESPASANTVIVIQGDHLSHHYTPRIILRKLQKTERKMLFLINAPEHPAEKIAVPGRTYDIAPTILHALKVKHNYHFLLGRDLLDPDTAHDRFNNTDLQQRYLEWVVAIHSESRPDVEKSGIVFLEKPFPMLKLGDQILPLISTRSRSNDIPRNGECFYFTANKKFRLCRLEGVDRAKADWLIKRQKPEFCHEIIFGTEDSGNGFFYVYRSGRRIVKKHSENFGAAVFKPEEIFANE